MCNKNVRAFRLTLGRRGCARAGRCEPPLARGIRGLVIVGAPGGNSDACGNFRGKVAGMLVGERGYAGPGEKQLESRVSDSLGDVRKLGRLFNLQNQNQNFSS
jgi:hypothetical protein